MNAKQIIKVHRLHDVHPRKGEGEPFAVFSAFLTISASETVCLDYLTPEAEKRAKERAVNRVLVQLSELEKNTQDDT